MKFCLLVLAFLWSGVSGSIFADHIELRDGRVLEHSLFLGLDPSGTARIEMQDGTILNVPLAEIRSMRRAPRPAPAAEPQAVAANESQSREQTPADSIYKRGAADWLIPGYSRWRTGRQGSGAALFTGFGLSIIGAILSYRHWQDLSAQSNTDLAYNLSYTGPLTARFNAARQRSFAFAGSAVGLYALHLLDIYLQPVTDTTAAVNARAGYQSSSPGLGAGNGRVFPGFRFAFRFQF